jgi:all-trans-retinol 13,14-reductase
MNKYDVIIIGSGLGGLLCGYILSKEGFNVCILEKHSQPGGNLQSFTRHGHKFETGVHYIGALGPNQTLNRYWNYFGLTSSLNFQQLERDCFDLVAFGEQEFPLAQGFENFTDQLLQHFPGEKQSLYEYSRMIHEVVSAFPLYNLELPKDHREHLYTTQSIYEFLNKLSEIRNPKSKIRNPKSEFPNPNSQIRIPKSEIRNPKSEIRNPKSIYPPSLPEITTFMEAAGSPRSMSPP